MKQVQRNQAFFALPGSTKPKKPESRTMRITVMVINFLCYYKLSASGCERARIKEGVSHVIELLFKMDQLSNGREIIRGTADADLLRLKNTATKCDAGAAKKTRVMLQK